MARWKGTFKPVERSTARDGGNNSKEESTENVAEPPFSRIPLIYILPLRRKKERMEEEDREKRGARS